MKDKNAEIREEFEYYNEYLKKLYAEYMRIEDLITEENKKEETKDD